MCVCVYIYIYFTHLETKVQFFHLHAQAVGDAAIDSGKDTHGEGGEDAEGAKVKARFAPVVQLDGRLWKTREVCVCMCVCVCW